MTPETQVNPVPVMVTVVPPEDGPLFGLTLVTVGGVATALMSGPVAAHFDSATVTWTAVASTVILRASTVMLVDPGAFATVWALIETLNSVLRGAGKETGPLAGMGTGVPEALMLATVVPPVEPLAFEVQVDWTAPTVRALSAVSWANEAELVMVSAAVPKLVDDEEAEAIPAVSTPGRATGTNVSEAAWPFVPRATDGVGGIRLVPANTA